ncbi:iron-sulfur cluster carrier protein ApbC [Salinimonas chungwhensis]|uniref:iron-sulfur cluster carrier protein ApbC n=1 Tax=Salinimonas chungwhensis TaxID=265425 RepID=UPI0003800F46|nr:iron-sulfur cluster carrier protein ApbC [Salinimonas chungwhensis]
MFFRRKANKYQDFFCKQLAAYYSLDLDEIKPWVEADATAVNITLPFSCASQHDALKQYLAGQAEQVNLTVDNIQISQQISSKKTAHTPVKNIKNIIAVASGKGGVGKSTTAVNMAYALKQEGARVGILDADIYGPSIPIMLGNEQERPSSADNKHMQPPEAWGLVANSIGYLVSAEDAAIWRGPMASRALKQILEETLWPVLDYLIVDLPPGTGDIQLTMAQQVPLTAAVIVTTPQDLALADAQKGIAMFNKVDVPVLGLIENMSYYQCVKCGHKDAIFSEYGGEMLAEKYDLPLLGALPLNTQIREHADAGTPLVVTQPDSELARIYGDIARATSMSLALHVPDESDSKHLKGDPIAFRPE